MPVVSRIVPSVQPDNPSVQTLLTRFGRYGETYDQNVVPTKHTLADEGSYFVTTNPTIGTGIQLNANVTAFSNTNALFVIQNTNASSNIAQGASIYLDYIRLIPTGTLPTGTVAMHFAFMKSTISREPVTAANRTVLTAASMRSNAVGRASIAKVMSYANAGAMTVPAPVAGDPILGRCIVPTGLGILGDEYFVKFGGEDVCARMPLGATRATDVGRVGTAVAPMIVDPGEWWVCHMWWVTAATTAATFEFELAWWER